MWFKAMRNVSNEQLRHFYFPELGLRINFISFDLVCLKEVFWIVGCRKDFNLMALNMHDSFDKYLHC